MAAKSVVAGANLPGPSASPLLEVPAEVMYKGYRIAPGSYVVGHGAWSPRAVVSMKSAEGEWRSTPLYPTSSAKFPTRAEADRRALDVAIAWVDAAIPPRREPEA
jgi:hypothetical protein